MGECSEEPISVSLCYCGECQKRTGSSYGEAAFFKKGSINVNGNSNCYTRLGESGSKIKHYFCSNCGSTVYWEPEARPEIVAVAVGCFTNPHFQPPQKSFHLQNKPVWLKVKVTER
jgi:hypothetical protein